MKNIKKAIALILAAATILCFTACSGTKKNEFKTWFHDEVSPAYDAFVKTEYGKANAPAYNLSSIVVSSAYIDYVFDFIANGTKPEKGEITEAEGVYTYKEDTFEQTIEFDEKTTSIRVTHSLVVNGEKSTHLVTTITERSDVYYIQYFWPDFSEYYEISFTAENGEIKHERTNEQPYSIFGEDIPEAFAKES